MSDLKLFNISGNEVSQLEAKSVELEKSLQKLIEHNLETLIGVTFLASEHSTGPVHGGRIDTLGIDENNCPVIVEYKRTSSENVINQGLYYLDWLLDHKAEFQLLVMKTLDAEKAETVDWQGARVLCIAGDFTKYDQHAVQQINRNIELIRYCKFGDQLLLLELINRVIVQTEREPTTTVETATSPSYKTITDYFQKADQALLDRYSALESFLLSLGDDVEQKTTNSYVAFRRLKNFACIELRVSSNEILIFIKVNPDSIELEDEFTRDVRKIGHFGTGDLEIRLKSAEDLEKAQPLLIKSYESS